MNKRIPISGPSITKKEIKYVTEAVSKAWYENANYYHKKFEHEFSNYVGRKYAICLPSCTSAIHLSLLALGIGKGDEVIVPDITWIASAAPITYVGATPVFVDIDKKSWCISAESFESHITAKTKAVIPVDLYGGMPEMRKILQIAKNHKIKVIEDSAEAIGSEYDGKKAGSFGDVSVFSFHGSKTLTTGEGGMLVTNNKNIYDRASFLRDHGRAPGDRMFNNLEVAFKYKMSSMQAALGIAQLERVDKLVAYKRKIFKWYYRYLKNNPNITLNAEGKNAKNSYWMVTAVFNPNLGVKNQEVMKVLDKNNIDFRPFFRPLSSIPAYSGYKSAKIAQKKNKVSYAISPYAINLPSGMNMTEDLVKYVCDVINTIVKK